LLHRVLNQQVAAPMISQFELFNFIFDDRR
jgi:hypothetical protein